jgi:alpha-L-fucosidase 2
MGTRQWVGYSFAWIACIYARAQNGDSAAANLKSLQQILFHPIVFI